MCNTSEATYVTARLLLSQNRMHHPSPLRQDVTCVWFYRTSVERPSERASTAHHLITPSGSVRPKEDAWDDLLHPPPHGVLPLPGVSRKYVFGDVLNCSACSACATNPEGVTEGG